MKTIAEIKTFLRSASFHSFALFLIVALVAADLIDRRFAVKQINEHLDQFQLSRTMLDSRARIQVILVTAALEGRKLTPSEVDEITSLWRAAEYQRATTIEK